MTQTPNTRLRTGSLGCLGAFSIVCLLICSGLITAALAWLNPDWMDNHAFWRKPVHPKEEVTWATIRESTWKPAGLPGAEPQVVTGHKEKSQQHFADHSGAAIDFPAPVAPDFHASVTALNPAALHLPENIRGFSMLALEPDGARFTRPVKVTFPLSPPQKPGSTLHLYTRVGADWKDEGVTARVGPDGKTAEAMVTHFSDNMLGAAWDWLRGKAVDEATSTILDKALSGGDKWNPDFIDKLQKQSLVGIARINVVLQILNTQDGPLTDDQINQIWATDSSEATKLLDDMHGWVKKANPAFANFLVMMQLAHGANWDSIKKFGEPSWDWVKGEYFKTQLKGFEA